MTVHLSDTKVFWCMKIKCWIIRADGTGRRDGARSENLVGQVVMRRAAAVRRHLLFCQKLSAHPPLTPRWANDHIISKPRLGSGVAQKRAVLKGRPLRDRYALTTTYRRPRVVNTALPKVSGTHKYKVIHKRFYLFVISSLYYLKEFKKNKN